MAVPFTCVLKFLPKAVRRAGKVTKKDNISICFSKTLT